METPKEVINTLAYTCCTALSVADNTTESKAEVICYYQENNHITHMIPNGDKIVCLFSDNSALLISGDHKDNVVEHAVLTPSIIMNVLLKYYPYPKIGKVQTKECR